MLFNSTISSVPSIDSYVRGESVQSPYRVYVGEKISEEVRSPITMQITPLDKQILICVNRTLLSHSALLKVQLKRMFGIDVNIHQLQRRIHHMIAANYLMGHKLISPDGSKCATIFIRLGWRGAGVLKAAPNEFPQKQGYLASVMENPTQAKKILATAQFLVRCGVDLDKVSCSKTVLEDGAKRNAGKKDAAIVRPHAIIQDDQTTVFVEAVRQDMGWQDDLLNKLHRLDECCRHASRMNITIQKPTIILLAESSIHQREVMALLADQRYNFKVIFTNDVNVYERPGECLYTLPVKRSFFEKLLVG